MDYGMFSNIPGLYSVDASSRPPVKQSKMTPDITKCPWGVVSPWLTTTHLTQACYIGCLQNVWGPLQNNYVGHLYKNIKNPKQSMGLSKPAVPCDYTGHKFTVLALVLQESTPFFNITMLTTHTGIVYSSHLLTPRMLPPHVY